MLSEGDKAFITEDLFNKISVDIDKKINIELDKRIKPKSWLVTWSETWFRIATPITIVGAVWWFAKNQALQLSEDQKTKVLTHIEYAPDPEVLQEIRAHVQSKAAHMSKMAKDSSYVTRGEYEELIKNTAIDIYNAKRSIDRIEDSQYRLTSTLKAMNYKLDKIRP